MKKMMTLLVAVMLTASLTACAGTTMTTERYRDHGHHPTQGNVSTTPNGQINGTNPTDGSRDVERPLLDNTNAMGAGNR